MSERQLDHLHFVAENRAHRPRPSFNNDAKIDLFLNGELLPDVVERPFKIQRGAAGITHTSNCVPAFFDDMSHQLLNMVQARLRRRILRYLIYCDLELHGRADKTL